MPGHRRLVRRWECGGNGPLPLLVVARVAEAIAALSGWRRDMVAMAAGAISVLSLAPFFLAWVLFATLPVLIWLVDAAVWQAPRGAGWRQRGWLRAARVGWMFGFGYHLAGLYWIGAAFLVEADVFGWLLPLAVTALPAGLALFSAAALAAASWLWHPGLTRVVAFAVAFAAAEWLRGHVLTGFPWNLLGYALTGHLVLMQSAALVGAYGLTLIAALAFPAPAVAFADAGSDRRAGRRLRRAGGGVMMALVPAAAMLAYGYARLAETVPSPLPGVMVRIVQPSVPQREKWRPEHQRRIFLDHLDLSAATPGEAAGITHVLWPEAAMPFQPLRSPEALALIAERLPSTTLLISGAIRATDSLPSGGRRAYNSLMVFRSGVLTTSYDKTHLVPFGEYLPFQSMLESIGLEQLTRLRGGFSIGVEPRPLLHIPGLPAAAPLICYEAIFPGAVVQSGPRPGLLVNVTNDGWFGATSGPHQHFQQARVRAVEEGLPLLRAANNGISGVIDPWGRVLAHLDLDVRGVIDSTVPSARAPTPYARWGDGMFWAAWTILGGVLAGLAYASGGIGRRGDDAQNPPVKDRSRGGHVD